MKLKSSQRWAIGAVLLTLLIACSRNPFEGPRLASAPSSGHAEASAPANPS